VLLSMAGLAVKVTILGWFFFMALPV